jgi:hypothetical protein
MIPTKNTLQNRCDGSCVSVLTFVIGNGNFLLPSGFGDVWISDFWNCFCLSFFFFFLSFLHVFVGERWTNPDLARTLREVGKRGKAAFYEGEIAREIVRAVTERGGVLSMADLASHQVSQMCVFCLFYFCLEPI